MAGDHTELDIAPFERLGPADAKTPLVIAVPHAGRHYPPGIERQRAVPWATLHALEDRHADQLLRPALAEGAVAIVAQVARAWIDLNRAESDHGPGASPRGRSGLGLVPARLGGHALWREPPDARAVARRIAEVHRPYHAAVAAALEAAVARHGHALLLDGHSMPPLVRGGSARIVIGDRHGASAAAAVSQAALAAARASGLCTARNAPYAGAYTLDRHGRPGEGIHAIQIEVDRTLYVTAHGEPGRRVAEIGRLIAAIGWAAAQAASGDPLDIAAE